MSEGEATDPLREAARKLIGAYMADEDLAPHINALEAAAGFCQQVIYPDGSVTYPTTLELAVKWATRGGGYVLRAAEGLRLCSRCRGTGDIGYGAAVCCPECGGNGLEALPDD